MTISFPSGSLPSDIKECNVHITSCMNTDIALPPGSSLVSGVYNVALTPHIPKLNQAVEVVIEHCSKVKARANGSTIICGSQGRSTNTV